ncbi:MAG TPA: hypothetical protein VFP33_11670 [Gallionella sp.]|nr:hypothetical protein [Gallionella sp.]
MKSFFLFLVLLLPACSIIRPSAGTTVTAPDAVKETRKSKVESPPVARPAPDATQPPVKREPGGIPPKKREHNIEED